MDLNVSSKEILDIAKNLVIFKLCDNCFGRQFGKIGHGMTNEERGRQIREYLNIPKIESKTCWLCKSLISEIEKFSRIIMQSLQDYEYETFLVGSRISDDISEKEKKLGELTNFSEPIKQEVNREIGKIVERKTGKSVDFNQPDIVALIDTSFDIVTLDVRSLYIYGRYWKFIRGIPQTKWFCKKCQGIGCHFCDYTGKRFESSIEELIGKTFLEKSKGTEIRLHGAGREDIDAKMLGNGRPFIFEIKNPKKRFFSLEGVENESNDYTKKIAKINNLRYASKEEIAKLKSAKWEKTYRVEIHGEIDKRKLKEAVMALRDKIICQRTPNRVLHRRPDIERKRKIIDIQIEEIMEKNAVLTIRAEAGTYIKELIDGDNGRTTPSVTGIIGKKIETEKLDVIQIHDQR
jgi:tRNA pseudouridine synthase 10